MKNCRFFLSLLVLLLVAAGNIAPVNAEGLFTIANEQAISMALSDSRTFSGNLLYWSSNLSCPGGEFSTTPCKIRSAWISSPDAVGRIEYESDTPDNDIKSNIVAHDFSVYWLSVGGSVLRKDTIYSSAVEIIAEKENGSSTGEIAVDDTYIYWTENIGDTGQLFRAPKAGGPRELIASSSDSDLRQLKADGAGGILYVADINLFLCCEAVLHRVTPNGSDGFDTVYSVSSFVNTYTIGGGYVYSAANNVIGDLLIMRAPLADISDETELRSIPASGSVLGVDSIVVDDTNLYWHETVSPGGGYLFRRNLMNSVTEPMLGFTLYQVSDLVSNNAYIAWHNQSVVYSLPTDVESTSVDLRIRDIEVTQAIQTLDNSVPLVNDKPTTVRVIPGFISASGVDRLQAVITLHGTRTGGDGILGRLPNSPLSPLSVEVKNQIVDGELIYNVRDLLDDTVNFRLPYSWLTGDISLRAEISAFGPYEIDPSNNEKTVSVSFQPKANMCAKFLPIATTSWLTYRVRNLASGNYTPGFMDIVQRFDSLWPVSRTLFYTQITSLRKPCFLCAPNPPFNMVDGADVDPLMFALWEHNVFDEAPDWCGGDNASTRYVAMVHPGIDTTRTRDDGTSTTLLGYASTFEPLSLVKMVSSGTGFNAPRAGSIMAQELAHNLNGLPGPYTPAFRWTHVNCGLTDGSGFNSGYPYEDPCLLDDDLGERSNWGYDRITESVIQPDEAQDFMSYGDSPWVSDYTWRGLMDATSDLPGTTSITASTFAATDTTTDAAGATSESLVATGRVDEDSSEGRITIAYLIPAGFDTSISRIGTAPVTFSPYRFELLSPTDEVMAYKYVVPVKQSYSGLPGPSTVTGENDRSFSVEMPFADGAVAMRVLYEDVEILRKDISTYAPVIANVIVSVGTGGTDFSVKWEASDEDGDLLHYLLQYSANGGENWRVLTTGLTDTTFNLPSTLELAGSNDARVRVIANDGVNMGSDISAPFSLKDNAPAVFISIPKQGKVYNVSDTIMLEGSAIDQEDGLLEGKSLHWKMNDSDVIYGYGGQLTLHNLRPGQYAAKLIAQDQLEQEGSSTVSFVVAPKYIDPAGESTVTTDGICDDAAYHQDREPLLLRYPNKDFSLVRFVQDTDNLHVCLNNLPVNFNAAEYLSLRFDTDNSGGDIIGFEDKIYYVLRDGSVYSGYGDGQGGEAFDLKPSGIIAEVNTNGDYWDVEIRIDKLALSTDPENSQLSLIPLSISHVGVPGKTQEYIDLATWPHFADREKPASWGLAVFSQQTQQIEFLTTVEDYYLGDMSLTLNAKASSGLSITYKSTTEDICTVSYGILTAIKTGECRIIAYQDGNSSFTAASEVEQLINIIVPDSDEDGLFDDVDNCVMESNPEQVDTDNDGEGDVCDFDDDNDGLPDKYELSHNLDPLNPDTDDDGILDGNDRFPNDSDRDNDGVNDANDLCPDENATGFDVDGDGCIDSFTGLIDLVDRLVSEEVISEQLQNSLLSKISNAEKSTSKENICAAINGLEALKNQIEAQTGKKIFDDAANEVITYIDSVIAYQQGQLPAGDSCN